MRLFSAGSHENIVGYYTSWFENEQLYIQMELCDQSLSIHRSSKLWTEREALEAMHQVSIICGTDIAHKLDYNLPNNEKRESGERKLFQVKCSC